MTRCQRAPALFPAFYLAVANALDPAEIWDKSRTWSPRCTTARVRRRNMREIPSPLAGAAGVASGPGAGCRVPGAGAARSRPAGRAGRFPVRFRQGTGGGPGPD